MKFQLKIGSYPYRYVASDDVLIGAAGENFADDENVDIGILLEDGKEYTATFFTIKNLKKLLNGFQKTGEAQGGLYIWAVDMIVVNFLSDEVILKSISDLINSGDIEKACSRIN